MKSNTRTVLATTLSSASSYTSDPLAVGDLYELLVTIAVTAISDPGDTYIEIWALDANGYKFVVSSLTDLAVIGGDYAQGVSIGSGLTVPNSFGDQVQLHLHIPGGETISAALSVIGKG